MIQFWDLPCIHPLMVCLLAWDWGLKARTGVLSRSRSLQSQKSWVITVPGRNQRKWPCWAAPEHISRLQPVQDHFHRYPPANHSGQNQPARYPDRLYQLFLQPLGQLAGGRTGNSFRRRHPVRGRLRLCLTDRARRHGRRGHQAAGHDRSLSRLSMPSLCYFLQFADRFHCRYCGHVPAEKGGTNPHPLRPVFIIRSYVLAVFSRGYPRCLVLVSFGIRLNKAGTLTNSAFSLPPFTLPEKADGL